MLDLKRLKSLVVVAEEGSLGRAAARLNLSQPALSRRMRELEGDLGFALFERVGRGIRLSGQAQGFLAQCRALVAHADALAERAKSFARGEAGVLRVGASPQTLEHLFPELLLRYRARWPLAEVGLVEGTSADLDRWLERGDIDLALIARPRADRFASRPVPPIAVLVALARSHPLAGASPIDLRGLVDEPFLLLHRGYRSRQAFDAACRLDNVEPLVRLESGAPHTLLALAEAGLGVAVIPSTVPTGGYGLHLAPLFHAGKPLAIEGMVCWLADRYLPAYAEHFVAEIIAVAEARLGHDRGAEIG